MITIVDYGVGNLHSIQYKLEKEGFPCCISKNSETIRAATVLILAGVGHFGFAMQNLKISGLLPVLNFKVLEEKTPIFGICLGFQLFTKYSQEGHTEGLGWIEAETRKFDFNAASSPLKIPHVGWNTLSISNKTPFLEEISDKQRFYFTHSYHVICSNPEVVAATTQYGHAFVSAIHQQNIFGTQFHPEKSHRKGVEVLFRFIRHHLSPSD